MVVQHGGGGVGDVALLAGQLGVEILVKVFGQLLDDDGAVGDLLAVELDERQLTLGRSELHLVVHVLSETTRAEINNWKLGRKRRTRSHTHKQTR